MLLPCSYCKSKSKGGEACRRVAADRFQCSRCKGGDASFVCSNAFQNTFFCQRCAGSSDEPVHKHEGLRFHGTDFTFKHGLIPCSNCIRDCSVCKLPRKYCVEPTAHANGSKVYGWCGDMSKHKASTPTSRGICDVDNQPDGAPDDEMLYFYTEDPFEVVAPWSPLYVRHEFDKREQSPYEKVPEYTSKNRRGTLAVTYRENLTKDWALLNAQPLLPTRDPFWSRRLASPATSTSDDVIKESQGNKRPTKRQRTSKDLDSPSQGVEDKTKDTSRPAQSKNVFDKDVHFMPQERVVTCRRICSLYAYLDIYRFLGKKHIEPGRYKIKWRIQLFKIRHTVKDTQVVHQKRVDTHLTNLCKSLDAVEQAWNGTGQSAEEDFGASGPKWDRFFTDQWAQLDDLSRLFGLENVVAESRGANRAPTTALTQSREQSAMKHGWSNRKEICNPFNYPMLVDKPYGDMPILPTLRLTVGYGQGLPLDNPENKWGRGSPMIADQVTSDRGRIDTWLGPSDHARIIDQGWVGVEGGDFEVLPNSYPVLIVSAVDSGIWLGGFRFGGVEIIRLS